MTWTHEEERPADAAPVSPAGFALWRPSGRVLALCLVLAPPLVAVTWPGPWWPAGLPLVAQAVALRGTVAVGAGLAAVLVGLAAWRWGTGALRRGGAAVAAVLVAVALGQVAVLGARGLSGMAGAEPAPASGERVVVLALNTEGEVQPAELAAFVAGRGADVVALPETSRATALRAAELLAAEGLAYQVLSARGVGGTNPDTSALVSTSLGDYEVTAQGAAASLLATGTGPPIGVVHTRAPVDPDLAWWRRSTTEAVSACAVAPGAIVAGDLNATLDHPAFGSLDGCVDAAEVGGAAGVATWPSTWPRWAGAPIDHVLVDPDVWQVERAAVLEPPGSTDHRALEVVLAPVDPPGSG